MGRAAIKHGAGREAGQGIMQKYIIRKQHVWCGMWCGVCDTLGLCGVGWGVYCFLLLPVGVCFLCGGVFWCVWWWFENSRACFVLLFMLICFVSCGLIWKAALCLCGGVWFLGWVFDCQ